MKNLDMIEDILSHNKEVVVIIDEAYIDFGGKSALELIEKYDNLVIVQTFSKSRSLAGMRIGYAISRAPMIEYLNAVKHSYNSYTMNRATILCGVASLKDDTYFNETIKKIVNTRQWAEEELSKLGFTFTNGKGNFIFATHKKCDIKKLFESLKKENIYVRHWNSERISDYLRITVGTKEEMQDLFESLKRNIENQ